MLHLKHCLVQRISTDETSFQVVLCITAGLVLHGLYYSLDEGVRYTCSSPCCSAVVVGSEIVVVVFLLSLFIISISICISTECT